MVLITFPNGSDWFNANWAFRQLAADVSNRYREDAALCKAFELAQAFGGLDLTTMDHGFRSLVMQAMRTIAKETLDGKIEGWRPHDLEGRKMYRDALSELVKLIDQQFPATSH